MPLSHLILAFNTGCLLFLFFINATRRRTTNKLANFWFSIFLVSIVFASLSGNMLAYNLDALYPHLFKLTDLTAFAIAPALFLTAKYFTRPKLKLNRKDWLHFLPVLSFFAVNGKYFLIFSSQELAAILESSPNKEVYTYLKYFLVLQCAVYLVLCLWYLYKYRNDRGKYDATNTEPLKWLSNALIGIMVMFILWIADRNGLFANIISIGYGICIYYWGYWIINQREVFPYSEDNRSQLSTLLSERDQGDTKRSGDDDINEKDKALLVDLMESRKPYLDPELNIFKLAKIHGSTVHELSNLINKGFDENFNQFVNQYRVEESKKLLASKEHDNLSMLGIAYEAGFNSKTVFNSTFKKIVGKTPTAYKKSCSDL